MSETSVRGGPEVYCLVCWMNTVGAGNLCFDGRSRQLLTCVNACNRNRVASFESSWTSRVQLQNYEPVKLSSGLVFRHLTHANAVPMHSTLVPPNFPVNGLIPNYLFSIRSTCIAIYAKIRTTPQITPNPITSGHKAWVLKPKAVRMLAPGTSISMPYLWSIKRFMATSFTRSAS